MLKIRNLILTFCAGVVSFQASGQLTTSTAATPGSLVEDVLVGSGVAVSGIVYTGHSEAIGSFNGSATNLGLDNGIILTTGTVLNTSGGILGEQKGPFGPNDTGSSGMDNSSPGYGPLTTLAGEDTENAAILEFDFVPQSDTVKFRYVFGSDEYPEFVGSEYNDVFAFYISGPGFGGTYNMAQISGGGGPVSINNINNGTSNTGPCQNCSYYNNNGTGSTAPFADSEFYIQYDGFTEVMEASAPVQCGETYHLIIAIADAGDGAYDSGIFLEANSLASYLPIELTTSLANNHYGDLSLLAEGCETASVTVTRDAGLAGTAQSIPLDVLGTAAEGIDFENLPATVDFPIGVTSVTVDFDVYYDGVFEGDETLILQLNYPDPCGDDNFISMNFIIKDVEPVVVTVPDKSVHCPLEETILSALVTGGLPDYTYVWSSGGTESAEAVSPGVTSTFTVTVTDACIGDAISGSGTVTVPVYPPMDINTTPDTSVLCPNTPLVLTAEVTGGEGTYSIVWMEGTTVVGSGPIHDVSPMVTTTYTVAITDGCGVAIEKDITVTVIASVLELQMSPDQLICPGDSADLWVIATEGLGNYTYDWLHSGETTDEVTVWPNNTTTYTVSVEDDCHTYSIEDVTTVEVIRPTANFNILSTLTMEDLLVSFQNTSLGAETYWWDLGNTETSDLHSPSTVYQDAGWYDVTLIAYNEIGCADTISKPIYIKPEFYFYAPNAFTPDGNRFNNAYEVSVIGATDFTFQIFNRWGELVFETTDPYFQWDGTYNNGMVLDDVYVWKAKIRDRENNDHVYEGTVTVLR